MNNLPVKCGNPELEAAAQYAMYNIIQDTQHTNPFPIAGFEGRFETMMQGWRENILNFFGNSQETWHQAITQDFIQREATRQHMQEAIAQQQAQLIVQQQELKNEATRFYDSIYKSVLDIKEKFNVNSDNIQKYSSTVLKEETDKAVRAFLKESLGVVKDNAQLFVTTGYFLAKNLLKEVSQEKVDNEKLAQIKEETIDQMLQLKKDEVTKLFQECVANPTPGCNEQVKQKMDELSLLNKGS